LSSSTSLGGTTQAPAHDNGAFAGPAMSSASLGSMMPHAQPGRALTPSFPEADDCVYVYLTIQLYSIEKEFYLVDFKAAGYERLIRRLVRQVEPEDEDIEHHSFGEDQSDSDDDDDEHSHRHRTDTFTAGKPREAGHWDALRKMSSHSNRKPGRGGLREDEDEDEEDEADSDGGFKSGIKLKEEYFGDGRIVDEKDVSSPFPFLDVASRLIIQLAEAD
jgi:carbon catabolite-derepressing protein kinase